MVSITTQLKFLTLDSKNRLADVLDYEGIVLLGKTFPGTKANRFMEYFIYSDETIDGKSKAKAYALFESSFFSSIEVGTVKVYNKSILIWLAACMIWQDNFV